MTKTSSRSAKRKETKPYYKYGNVYKNKAQYIKYRNLEIKVFVVLGLIGLIVGLSLGLSHSLR